jgi:prepilin-type N-terminal cleavage/methylation domain-containing protein
MICGRRRDSRGAFTLIEVLIVITVIATLAIIVVPRLMSASRRGKEANLRANLKQLRDAIERFEGDCAAWPPALSDVMAANGAAISADVDARGISVDRVGYSGPYLHTPDGQPPKDIFTGSTDWNYNSSTGELHSSSTLAALDGTSYATW